MRVEYIEYKDGLPIDIKLIKLKEYPMHWIDSIEIIYVLKGKIEIGIDDYYNILEEGDIEIVNINEMRWFEAIDEDNLILVINIDPDFFEKYYPDAKATFFYTDIDEHNRRGDTTKNEKLRKYLSILLFEKISKLDDYKEKIEETLLDMMFFLLNNFHYLFYEGENLEEDKTQLERYHRIINYLDENYMNKVSLQEIAESEYLSPQYLSYKIKDTFGMGFNEYLNQIRVQEATKLLISTDRSISDISDSVGFSHARYFNRHFKLNYNMTPTAYRKKYKIPDEEVESLKKIEYIDLKEGIKYIQSHIRQYDRFFKDSETLRIDIDLFKESISEYCKPEIINLGDAINLLEEENHKLLEEIQREIRFKYGLISNLFSDEMNIYMGKDYKFINWTKVENIINYMLRLKLIPVIDSEGVSKKIIDDFINHFKEIYNYDIESWFNKDLSKIDKSLIYRDIEPINDRIFMVPFIINSYLNHNQRIVLSLVDHISKDIVLTNDTFFGGYGICTNNGLNKASYYAYLLLSLLGDEVIDKGEGYIVTKSEEGYQILLYHYLEDIDNIVWEKELIKSNRKVSINLYNSNSDFQISKYDLNIQDGSPYNKWEKLGSPERLDNWNKELLKRYVHPKISYYYKEESMVLNIFENMKQFSTSLYILNIV